MNSNESFQKKFNEKSLKIVLVIYMICCIMSFIMFSTMKLAGFNNDISVYALIILGILVTIYGIVFYKCYKWTLGGGKFNLKGFNSTKIALLIITYFQYLYLNFTMHLNSVWLIIFFFIVLGALLFDLKMIVASIVLSILCETIVFIHNPSILNYKSLGIADPIMTVSATFITFALVFMTVYMASRLLKSITEKEIEIKSENQKLLDLFNRISEISNIVLSSSENLSSAIEEQTGSLVEISEATRSVSKDSDNMLDKSSRNKEVLNTLLDANEVVVDKTMDSEDKINDFISTTDKNQKSLKDTLLIITNIKNGIEDTFKSTKDLEEKSKKVDEILNLIGNISEQTNLLALNASIEAARAGEYGKGFAVVADEIRKLAEGTKESLNQASTIVNELKNKINIVQEQMSNNNQHSKDGNSIITETVKGINKMTSDLKLFSNNIMDINKESNMLLTKTKNAVQFNEEISSITKSTISKYEMVTETISQNAATSEEIEANINELRNVAEDMNKLVK